ncbi:ribokinase [Halobacillus naozhouensis]|uniref:Ribokinase n=1 Tax=Halobacillus naozhouensis TaxID=554880 RepID=A0ABY8IXI5_9BACI|nr:ribokinase [Halobacillus naozhouensis]WFT74052.1 ribokinase [Halobacillus naozhouensis]
MKEPTVVVVGSLNMDIVIEADRAPLEGETIMGNQSNFIPGGKGANQAVALSRLGAETTMLGTIGNDPFGTSLLQSLEKNGVDTGKIKKVDDAPTGIASILLAEGDNRIVVVPGANNACLSEDIDEQVLKQADLVLLQLEIPLPTVIAAARLAKKHGKMVVLNPAPAQSLPQELLQNVDYITPNQSELGVLSDMVPDAFDLSKAMRNLQKLGVKHVITTLGEKGSAYMSDDSNIQTIAGYEVPVVDTTGAGDAFNAGLSYALGMNMSLDDAVRYASKVSALAVTKFGAQGGMPDKQEILAFKNPSSES